MAALKLAIFDVDGTLVDSQNSIVAAMADAFGAVGLASPARSEILSIVGLSLPLAFARLAAGSDPGTQAVMVAAYKDSYARNRAKGPDRVPFYEGALDLLETLRGMDDVLLGIATGKSARGVSILLENHGLNGCFQTVQVADHHPSKPHPSMLFAAMRETGVEPRDTVMIGDTTFDIEMACSAGVAAIGVAWGYHRAAQLSAAGAAAVAGTFAEVLDCANGLWGRA